MKKVRIPAGEFAEDIKSGAADSLLMEKYGLSPRSLEKAKTELLARGLLPIEGVARLDKREESPRSPTAARDFLESFSKTPDDYALMAQYSLKPHQLKVVYERLIKRGLLSEYQFNTRAVKAPEIDGEANPRREDSTSITWKTELVDTWKDSTEIRKFLLCLADGDVSQGGSGSQKDNGRTGGVEGSGCTPAGGESCPKCGHPKDPSIRDSCSRCGIVYAKIDKIAGQERIGLWRNGVQIR